MNDMSKFIVNSGGKLTTEHNALTARPVAIGSLPKPSLLESVNLPGEPVTYRVRRDIVVSAAQNIKLKP